MSLLDGLLLARASVDRGAAFREDPDWLGDQLGLPGTRLLLVHRGRFAVQSGRARWCSPAELLTHGLHDTDVEHYLLGVSDGPTAWVAAHLPHDVEPLPADLQWATLREVAAGFDDHDVGLTTTAVALAQWHMSHRHCPRCGSATQVRKAGWVRTCPDESVDHFPRTDPAIIALVRNGERILLGHRADWPTGRFSTFAGFVEPGESSEMALEREILEECGLRVDPAQVTYRGSQPWPFPASLMIGYEVGVHDGEAVPDGEEISEVRWFTRESLRAALDDGEVVLPPPVSIARRLIERWYGEPIAERGGW